MSDSSVIVWLLAGLNLGFGIMVLVGGNPFGLFNIAAGAALVWMILR